MTQFRTGWIKNFDTLAVTENRKLALQIVSAGLDAIDTERVILSSVKLENNILTVQGESFPLDNFKKIKIVGFGKASPKAALALEKILGNKISQGAVIGLEKVSCDYIETFSGTHPRPSEMNIEAGRRIYDIVNQSDKDDLIIVLISGGGSALLCYSLEECAQGQALYDSFLKFGKTITEINTVRKHLSILKGGGLAKLAYPATVIGLVFSDIPGNHFENVASGSTYKDESLKEDAEKIINEHNLGNFNLTETPKEDKYFEKVRNFVLVSNISAVEAMKTKSEELGLEANIVSTELYEETEVSLRKIFSAQKNNSVVLSAGEPSIMVMKGSGKGGRNTHIALKAVKIKMVGENSVFISLASDGVDNSDAAGAIADKYVLEKTEKLNLNADDYLNRFDSYSFFEKSGDLILTGPTGANVSDLMILLTKN